MASFDEPDRTYEGPVIPPPDTGDDGFPMRAIRAREKMSHKMTMVRNGFNHETGKPPVDDA